ncbi:MAG: hypothetical protein P4M11_06180 [Candidatus Pacebacteria bacterium]|nr:hypothetical protein [Candidatus Paceibacterota bacterium]
MSPPGERPRRYMTHNPITDEMLAIERLTPALSRNEYRFLVMEEDDYPPTIHIEGWNGGFGQMEYNGSMYYAVDQELVEKLIDAELLEKAERRVGKGWQYNATYLLDLRSARQRHRELANERAETMRPLLKPGVHSRFSSLFLPNGYRWEETEDGDERLCFYFKTPAGDNVRVFYDTRDIEVLEAEKIT